MFAIDISTFIAVITVLLSIIFFLLITKSKPNKSQILEMQEVGAEIVEQIQVYVKQFEEERLQLEQIIQEVKNSHTSQEDEVYLSDIGMENEISDKKEGSNQIVKMYREGHTVEEIAKMLGIQRGVIEVSLNFENIEAR